MTAHILGQTTDLQGRFVLLLEQILAVELICTHRVEIILVSTTATQGLLQTLYLHITIQPHLFIMEVVGLLLMFMLDQQAHQALRFNLLVD